jgi:hypothetical protein
MNIKYAVMRQSEAMNTGSGARTACTNGALTRGMLGAHQLKQRQKNTPSRPTADEW